MRMDLIQPFINSTDAVLAQALESSISLKISPWKKRPTGGKGSPPRCA